MKLQCPCGAKYAFDISPDMLQNPVKFVCPSCGLDSSAFVNEMIRQEFGGATASASPQPPPPPPPMVGPSHMRIAREELAAEPAAEASAASQFCPKHRNELATEKCFVCQKPICPKCMDLFGYFCSPLCKNKAEQHKLKAPVYAGRRDLVEAKFWRNIGLIGGGMAVILVLFLGAWFWYAWFGSVPHPYLTVKFSDDNRAYAGASQLVGNDQVIFLHGGTLARYDLKTKKEIWSKKLISKQQIDDVVKQDSGIEQKLNSGRSFSQRITPTDIERLAKKMLQSQLQLLVDGKNVWVEKGNSLTHYDWDTGKVVREINLPEIDGRLTQKGGELLVFGDQSVTHVSLATGDSRVERFSGPGGTLVASANSNGGLVPANNNQPLNPQKVESQAQNMNLPRRIALPALLANAEYERKLEAELNDNLQHSHPNHSSKQVLPRENSRIVSGETGIAEFTVTLLKEHLVTRNAMKAPPKKSVLNGNLNSGQTTEAANEILNNMQRSRGGGKVTEDESLYQVTVHLPQSADAPDWTGEVTGPPQLFVLKSVNVIAAGKEIIVLDKSNKKLWQTKLTYTVPKISYGSYSEESEFGKGPCVEHGDSLYVFDKAVLSAFDLHSGNARWRLPSVGTVGLFFDNKNDIYVNTTSANPEDLKYSRQIDITRKTEAMLFKIDSKTGKVLWKINPGGFISYMSGDFIYTIQSYDSNPTDKEQLESDLTAVLRSPSYLRIKRIRPSDGRVLWEYYQDRCPVDARFDKNSIELVYKGELQVLRYIVL